ncbi:MAG: hypothetical protein DRQ88_11065 [Epsilonproteobacteria bacterium]|nr:MAG: hypothetical protein DRQ88_11065 [Campylobacterota bacterium]
MRLIILLFCFSAFGEVKEYVREHKSCQLTLLVKERTTYPELFETLETQLKDRSYKFNYVTPGHRFAEGDLYLNFTKEILSGLFFPPCYIKIEIKEASGQKMKDSDKIFFSHATKRLYPRHSPSGTYRCKLAVRDVIYHLPYCRLPKKD